MKKEVAVIGLGRFGGSIVMELSAMNVDVLDNSRKRQNGTECILCMECVKNCPKKAL